ncbi:TIGR01459 family HAD-type hydrolase [Hwanghaeella grinnelliae]|uniref:TIGR01459 family HAD-type hydrolase n=1 Tax=Hwanghaeella grinnelliae TaxID=2500179 RepID=A0A437QN98_9PROT|nr:TIGR01459 family HAD-type hydrolase [Hwanghaeella grinnelliae]RVU35889.1 TIGR01459 family HAD-type hydrolase [Hwanghaeella grinnelliae]
MAEQAEPSVQIVDGIGSLADDYDTYLLDQFGVIHDGVALHDGAHEAMRNLANAGKKVIILSNSGKRASDSHGRLDSLGVDRSLYLEIITSGELVYRNLSTKTDPFYEALGPRFLMFAWDSNRGIVEGTDFEEVERIGEADFILCAGTDHQDLSWYEPALAEGLSRDLPMICANPDRVAVQPDGSLKMCPGAVAEVYEQRGGRVRWHGKPTLEVYEMCGEIAGGLDRAIGVGDSLIHDIKGANDAGIDSLLILGGIHSEEVAAPVTPQGVDALATKYGARPTHAAALFRW